MSAVMQQSQPEYEAVTIDMRALIDNVLARYSGEFSVFRELLQNSDDAGCDAAEIRFETTALLERNPEAAMDAGPHSLSDLETTNVAQWTFKNHGQPFREQDWLRLRKIASGNPDSRKVGAFGVGGCQTSLGSGAVLDCEPTLGFYSLFSVTENPYVSSGNKEMEFSWGEGGQLRYRFGVLPGAVTVDLWTTFKMPLREHAPMPRVSGLMKFLATSITFMVHLKDVAVFFDSRPVGRITKYLGQSKDVPIPEDLQRRSPKQIMMVKSVWQHRKSFQLFVFYVPTVTPAQPS
ncbi:hypothetical protein EDD16DRAFT_1791884 [Pisolithus croceorrhizus]|nr:hypothetical protein EDD16DRAFT_1791884 [Pisolithus croceorrhizus]